MWPNMQFPADVVTFSGKVYGKIQFLFSPILLLPIEMPSHYSWISQVILQILARLNKLLFLDVVVLLLEYNYWCNNKNFN